LNVSLGDMEFSHPLYSQGIQLVLASTSAPEEALPDPWAVWWPMEPGAWIAILVVAVVSGHLAWVLHWFSRTKQWAGVYPIPEIVVAGFGSLLGFADIRSHTTGAKILHVGTLIFGLMVGGIYLGNLVVYLMPAETPKPIQTWFELTSGSVIAHGGTWVADVVTQNFGGYVPVDMADFRSNLEHMGSQQAGSRRQLLSALTTASGTKALADEAAHSYYFVASVQSAEERCRLSFPGRELHKQQFALLIRSSWILLPEFNRKLVAFISDGRVSALWHEHVLDPAQTTNCQTSTTSFWIGRQMTTLSFGGVVLGGGLFAGAGFALATLARLRRAMFDVEAARVRSFQEGDYVSKIDLADLRALVDEVVRQRKDFSYVLSAEEVDDIIDSTVDSALKSTSEGLIVGIDNICQAMQQLARSLAREYSTFISPRMMDDIDNQRNVQELTVISEKRASLVI